jgi:serine protease Do
LRKEKTIRTFRMTDSQDNFILDDEPLLRNMDLESLKDLVSQESKAPKIGLKIQDSEEGDHVVVLKVTVGSPAAKAGLFKGDRITEIDGESVKNTEEVIEKLKEKENKSIYSIKFIRNKKEMNASLRMPKKLKIADL